MRVRKVRRPILERQNVRVLDSAVPDLDGAADSLIPIPSLGTGEHGPKEGKQGLADLPGGRVPQVGGTVIDGCSKDVGRAQENPMASSHDTSMMRLPGSNAARSSSTRNVNGASVSCSTQFTTMSRSARKPASGTAPVSVSAWAPLKCTIRAE